LPRKGPRRGIHKGEREKGERRNFHVKMCPGEDQRIIGQEKKREATEDHIYGRYKRAGNGEGHQMSTHLRRENSEKRTECEKIKVTGEKLRTPTPQKVM
jgi:hypothetical protein